MPKMSLVPLLSEDKQFAAIELHQEGEPLGHIELDAATLEGFIHKLGEVRAQMVEEVTPSLDPGSRVNAVPDPAWRIPNDPAEDTRLLALRHPGLGWVSFLLPIEKSKEIGRWLQEDRID